MTRVRTYGGTIIADTEWDQFVGDYLSQSDTSSQTLGLGELSHDHALEKNSSVLIRLNGSTIEAYYGHGSNQAGKLITSGTNMGTILTTVQPYGGRIQIGIGTFPFSTYASISHGIEIQGEGELTVLRQADGANLNYMLYSSLNSSTAYGRMKLEKFLLDGNKANQTGGLGYGIYFDTYSSTKNDNVVFRDLEVFDCYGTGIQTIGNYFLYENVNVRACGGYGFYIDDYLATLFHCCARNNTLSGIVLAGTGPHRFKSIVCGSNGQHGLYLYEVARIEGDLYCSGNTMNAIMLEGAQSCHIKVIASLNGAGAKNTYDNIYFKSSGADHSTDNAITLIVDPDTDVVKRLDVCEEDSNQDRNIILEGSILSPTERTATHTLYPQEHTINTVVAEKFQGSGTYASPADEVQVGTSLTTCYYGLRLYKIAEDGTPTEITGGSAEAVKNYAAGTAQTINLASSLTISTNISLDTTDAIKVEFYADGSNPPTSLAVSGISEQKYGKEFLAGTYPVQYRGRRTASVSGKSDFYLRWGWSADISKITNLGWKSKGIELKGASSKLFHAINYTTTNRGKSTGTGSEETIAHGLDDIPDYVFFTNEDDGANPYQSTAADETNIYVTAVSGKKYQWKAEVDYGST